MKNLPINLPERVVSGQPVSAVWANSIREAISRLANRKPTNAKKWPKSNAHPWKVSSNGDEFVSVAEGELLSIDHEDVSTEGDPVSTYFQFKKVMEYAGTGETPIEVTTATGFIYGEVPFVEYRSTSGGINLDPGGTPTLFWLQSIVPDTTGEIEVKFAETLPTPTGNVFIFEIARVELTDGVVSIVRQTLKHDPTLVTYSVFGGAASPP